MRWLFAARGVRSCTQGMLVVIVPLYIVAAGYSGAQLGLLLSLASLGSILMVVGVGLFADRYGRKPVLGAIALFSTAGALAYGLTTSFWVLVGMAALASVGGGGAAGSGGNWGPFYPAEQPLIAASVPDIRRNRAFARLSIIGVLGAAAGSLLAGLPDLLRSRFHLTPVEAFHPLFFAAAFGGLILFALVLPIREPRTRPRGRPPRLRRPAMAVIGRLWVTNGLNGFSWGILGPFFTYWLAVRFGANAAAVGTLYTIANLSTIVAYFASPRVASWLGSVRSVTITRLISVVGLIALAVSPTFVLAGVAFIGRTIFQSVGVPIQQSYVMGISDEESRSRVAALGNLPSQVTAMAAPSLGAYLLTAVSAEAPLWLASSVMLLSSVLYGWLFGSIRPPEEREAKFEKAAEASPAGQLPS